MKVITASSYLSFSPHRKDDLAQAKLTFQPWKNKNNLIQEDVDDFLDLLAPIITELSLAEIQEGKFIYWLFQCLFFGIESQDKVRVKETSQLLMALLPKFPEAFVAALAQTDTEDLPLVSVLLHYLSKALNHYPAEIFCNLSMLFKKIVQEAPQGTMAILTNQVNGTSGLNTLFNCLLEGLDLQKSSGKLLQLVDLLNTCLQVCPEIFRDHLGKKLIGNNQSGSLNSLLIYSLCQSIPSPSRFSLQ